MSLFSTMYKTYKANNLTKEKIKILQQKRLKKLVKYAKKNSPYFRELYKNIDVNSNFKIEQLPVINKVDMMKHFDEWLTDSNVTMKRIEFVVGIIE